MLCCQRYVLQRQHEARVSCWRWRASPADGTARSQPSWCMTAKLAGSRMMRTAAPARRLASAATPAAVLTVRHCLGERPGQVQRNDGSASLPGRLPPEQSRHKLIRLILLHAFPCSELGAGGAGPGGAADVLLHQRRSPQPAHPGGAKLTGPRISGLWFRPFMPVPPPGHRSPAARRQNSRRQQPSVPVGLCRTSERSRLPDCEKHHVSVHPRRVT